MTATQSTHSTYGRRYGAIKANKTRKLVQSLREQATIRATTVGHGADRNQDDPFALEPGEIIFPYPTGNQPYIHYDLIYWRSRFYIWADKVRSFKKSGFPDEVQRHMQFVRGALQRIRECEGGKYLVSATGKRRLPVTQSPDTRHEQAQAESVTLNSGDSTPVFSPSTTPDNPVPTKEHGAGVVSSNNEQDTTQSGVQAQQYDNSELATRQLAIGNDYRIETSATIDLKEQAKLDALADMQEVGLIDDDEHEGEEDSNDRDRLPALNCCEVNLRAAFEAFAKNDMATFIELSKKAQEDLDRYADDSKVLRERGWGVVASSLLKPEIIIPDAIESALTPPRRSLPSSVPAMTDPAIVIARAFGKAS